MTAGPRRRTPTGAVGPAGDGSDGGAAGSGTRRCVVSWSGGKDSSLALHRLRRRQRQRGDLEVVGLLTIFSPETGTSRSHGLPRGLLEEQARILGLPLYVDHASWEEYEAVFKRRMARLVEEGVDRFAFGDIYLDDHRDWVERVCSEVGARALEPLWGEETGELAREVLEVGFDARICTVRADRLAVDCLGRGFDDEFLDRLQGSGIDPCGEKGEFHTVVLSGPGMEGSLRIDEARIESSESHHHWIVEGWHAEDG